jgi:predicted ester cyclase
MSTESNKAVVRSFFERAINQGDLDWLDQIIAPGFAASRPGGPAHDYVGRDRARQMVLHCRQAFPDFEFKVQDLLAEQIDPESLLL